MSNRKGQMNVLQQKCQGGGGVQDGKCFRSLQKKIRSIGMRKIFFPPL